nr:hypothetical protein [Abalone asfa-like virus]
MITIKFFLKLIIWYYMLFYIMDLETTPGMKVLEKVFPDIWKPLKGSIATNYSRFSRIFYIELKKRFIEKKYPPSMFLALPEIYSILFLTRYRISYNIIQKIQFVYEHRTLYSIYAMFPWIMPTRHWKFCKDQLENEHYAMQHEICKTIKEHLPKGPTCDFRDICVKSTKYYQQLLAPYIEKIPEESVRKDLSELFKVEVMTVVEALYNINYVVLHLMEYDIKFVEQDSVFKIPLTRIERLINELPLCEDRFISVEYLRFYDEFMFKRHISFKVILKRFFSLL